MTKSRSPLLIDLCCGLGGWSRPWLARGGRAIGFDVERFDYPGELVIQDVRTLDGAQFRGAALIVASAPCQEFSRHDQPWTRAKNPPPPDLSLVEACRRIAAESGAPFIMENVRGAQRFIGPRVAHWGSFYLWGDGVPALLPPVEYRRKQTRTSSARAERAMIPEVLADFVASCYLKGGA